MIAGLHVSKAQAARAYVDAPFDLLYGFRGNSYNVDLLSPYEMLLHWPMEMIKPPTIKQPIDKQNAIFTKEGLEYQKECRRNGCRPEYVPVQHYVALDGEGRILVPDLAVLRSLRHRWCWKRRNRLHIPCWSFAKVPRSAFSPEENARLLSVYMRPWKLHKEHATVGILFFRNLGLAILSMALSK